MLACLVLSAGAYATASNNADEETDHLLGKWSCSYEDKKKWDDPEVYLRTDSKDWPPSRFRMRYVFNKDGNCEYLYLDPADAHRMVKGTWKRDGQKILISNEAGEQKGVSFEIVELTKDKLVFKKLK